MTTTPPEWIGKLLQLFPTVYTGRQGVLVTAIDTDGRPVDDEPIIADFGDILPFLWHYGARDFVAAQLQHAAPFLREGLYLRHGRLRLFSNHDWLLGLLDLYRQSGQEYLLAMAEQGARTIERRFFYRDLLIDEPLSLKNWRTWLRPASPFNGGYIELWLDLYRYTGNSTYLDNAKRLAAGWIRSRDFIEHGVFTRYLSLASASLNRLAISLSRLRARLFKDNTNLLWGLIALYSETGEERWRAAVVKWLEGYRHLFWNKGDVDLVLDPAYRGYNPALKGGFVSLDLLCDIIDAGIETEGATGLARSIADFWILQQWGNGLFPEVPGGPRDHLDANVDMVVSLAKLYDITDDRRYLNALDKCRHAILSLHDTPLGYCQAVDRDGIIRDARIIIKYQGLLMKLDILPEDPRGLLSDRDIVEILRDR